MPEPTPSPTQLKLTQAVPIPLDAAIYTGLKTDHYPWTDIIIDLSARQTREFTGVFDAWQAGRWARFLWSRGTLLGGYTHGGQAVTWNSATQALPRARVSLTELSIKLVDLLWSTRNVDGRALTSPWPAARTEMERQHFHGLLVTGSQCSFWAAGRLVAGPLPKPGDLGVLFSPNTEASRGALTAFWKELLQTIHRAQPLDAAWQAVTVRLADEHPCLDPFAQDIYLQNGTLTISDDIPVAEFRPALIAALRGTLARLGVRLIDLPITNLRDRPEWAASGLDLQ